MRLQLLLAFVLVGCADSGQGRAPNSVPGRELYIGCVLDSECPIELPLCRLHRFYLDSSQVNVLEVRQCTTECGDGLDPCPEGILAGRGGGYVGVPSVCLAINDEGVFEESSTPLAHYCYADDTPPSFDTEDWCETVGTVVTSVWSGRSQLELCLVDTSGAE